MHFKCLRFFLFLFDVHKLDQNMLKEDHRLIEKKKLHFGKFCGCIIQDVVLNLTSKDFLAYKMLRITKSKIIT